MNVGQHPVTLKSSSNQIKWPVVQPAQDREKGTFFAPRACARGSNDFLIQ
jgi:hypothetical protein